MNIYVSNLAPGISEDDLRKAFSRFGVVTTVVIMKDFYTGLSSGFGSVEMGSFKDAKNAILTLDGKDFKGKLMSVSHSGIDT